MCVYSVENAKNLPGEKEKCSFFPRCKGESGCSGETGFAQQLSHLGRVWLQFRFQARTENGFDSLASDDILNLI